MKTTREHVFFWLGVLVLPWFWSWFTLGRQFTRLQRAAAFSWLALTTALVAWQWHSLAEHLKFVAIGYPIVIGWVSMVLLVWLALRTGLFSRPSLFEVFVLLFILGPNIRYLVAFDLMVGPPFDARWLLPPLILMLLHLAIGPVKRKARGIPFLFGYTDEDKT